MPKEILVGAHSFEVLCNDEDWKDTELREQNTTLWGSTELNLLRIHIRPEGPATQQADTLLHEVFHCIYYVHDVPRVMRNLKDDSEELEEIVVSLLVPGLHAVMVRNLELVNYLLDPSPAPPPAAAKKRAKP